MKPIDISKFRTSITKSIPAISAGFNDPTTWLSTGNYCLNYLISNDFFKGVPLGKSTMFAGESGSGKSFIVSGNLVREAQAQGVFVIIIDTENALDEKWLHALGVDTDESKLLRISASMIDDVAKIMSEFMKGYKADYGHLDKEERPKILFVVDSLGMLMTPTDVAQFEKGDMKGDMGRKPKALKALITNVTNMFGDNNVGLVTTNHTYASQDMFDPDDKISGGQGVIYAASIVVAMQKRKLKEDEEGNKIADVTGIRSAIKVNKSRYSKPFESMEIKIPYDKGMNKYSGLMDFFEKQKFIEKSGTRWKYIKEDGEEIIQFRKVYERNTDGILDIMMEHFMKIKTAEAEKIGFGEELEGDETDFEELENEAAE